MFPANTVRKTRARIFAESVAAEALERIGALYAVEGDINGRSPEERREVRNTRGADVVVLEERHIVGGQKRHARV